MDTFDFHEWTAPVITSCRELTDQSGNMEYRHYLRYNINCASTDLWGLGHREVPLLLDLKKFIIDHSYVVAL